VANGLDCLGPARCYMTKLGSWIVSRSIISTHLAVGTTKLSLIAGMRAASFCQEFDQLGVAHMVSCPHRAGLHNHCVTRVTGHRWRYYMADDAVRAALPGTSEDTGGGRRPAWHPFSEKLKRQKHRVRMR
jgi:hypothetical protein